MPKVCWNSPVIRCEDPLKWKNFIPKSLDFIDSFFPWSGKHYQIVSKELSGKTIVQVSKKTYQPSNLGKKIKRALYLTVIAPIMVIFFKLIYRKICQFELLYNFDKECSVNMSNIALRPKRIPIPNSDMDTRTDVATLYALAQSLELNVECQRNILSLCQLQLNANDQNLEELKIYLKALVEKLQTTEMGPKRKREILLEIGRDCGSHICFVGNKQKVVKAFYKLYGFDQDSVKEIILNEIDDLKMGILNQIAYEKLPNEEKKDYTMHSHFISAFQAHLGMTLGLDYEAGLKDDMRNGKAVAPFFKNHNEILKRKKRFLEIYTPSKIVESLCMSLNEKKDDYGVTLKIGNYYEFISNLLRNNGYGLPKNLKHLKKGPLKDYVTKALENTKDQRDVKSIYEAALDEFINDKFFDFDQEQCVSKELKEEGCRFMLEMIGILK